jgi:hypothetical protein
MSEHVTNWAPRSLTSSCMTKLRWSRSALALKEKSANARIRSLDLLVDAYHAVHGTPGRVLTTHTEIALTSGREPATLFWEKRVEPAFVVVAKLIAGEASVP